jgi:antitoxin component YwqK of YwqJK toxin-antitoxin module
MRNILLPLAFLFSLSSTAQEFNQTDAQGRKQGPWKQRYENGALRYTGQFKDDKPVGTFQYFDETKTKTKEVRFEPDSSFATFFHTTGKVMAKGAYVGKTKVGEWLYYDEEGDLSQKESYLNGRVNGRAFTYYKNQQIAREQDFVEGVKNGMCKDYFKGGKPKFDATFLDGNLDGKVTHYFPNGSEWQRGQYKASVKDGKWLYFDENGLLLRIETFNLGKLVETKVIEEE